MSKYIKVLIQIMVLTSFFTHTIDLESSNLIISRMTFSDIFGLIAIALFIINKIIKRTNVVIPKSYMFGVVMIVCYFVTIFTSLNKLSTVYECLILMYLLLLSYVTYSVFINDIESLLHIIIITTFIMSFVGVYDLMAANNELPTFFKETSKRHGMSGFRYFAQAGNYCFTVLSILIPLKYSECSINKKTNKNLLNLAIGITLLFMLTTGAISIIISFIIAYVLFFIWNLSDKKIIKDTLYGVLIMFVFVMSSFFLMNSFYKNLIFRIKSRVTERQSGTAEASFIIENMKCTFVSFLDNIYLGTGLGGFVNNYSVFEIHGTYFKVIGETGIIGVLGYLCFMIVLIKLIVVNYKRCKLFIPFLIANLISWSYNYHLRKKEFWILFAVINIFLFVKEEKKHINE